jgi:hypothetical protein
MADYLFRRVPVQTWISGDEDVFPEQREPLNAARHAPGIAAGRP